MGYIKEVAKNIFLIELSLPLSVFTVNCYLIKNGEDGLLVDAGLYDGDCWYQLEQYMQKLGFNLSNLRGVVITHAHVDHYGFANQLRQLSGAVIYMHNKEKILQNVQQLDATSLEKEVVWQKKNGAPCLETGLNIQEYNNLSRFMHSVTPDIWLEGGEVINLAGRRIKVIWTPGHSAGHICLYVPDQSAFIVGDHILGKTTTHVGRYWWTQRNTLQDYLTSLDAISNYRVDLVLPGHGEPFVNLVNRCTDVKNYRMVRNRKILQCLGQGKRNAWQLVEELWGKSLNPRRKRLALADVLAHLYCLSIEGYVRNLRHKNIVYWEIAQL